MSARTEPAVPGDPVGPQTDSGTFVFLGVPDIHGALRGKAFTARAFADVLASGETRFTDLLLALDPVDEPITDYRTMGLRTGAPDLAVVPEPDTLRPLPWRPGWQVCLGTPRWADRTACGLAPRNVLHRVLTMLEALGLEPMASFEYEVRLCDADGAPLCAPLSYSFGELGPFERLAAELDRALDAMGIELSALHTEAGPGLLEINLAPRRGMLAADEALLVKSAVKDLARSLGLRASFLAKTVPDEEGSSGHLHLSLWDGADNIFGHGLAGRAAAATAGVLEHLPGASVLYNPNLNSYKRLVPGYFAPVNVSWGEENRSAAVRTITASRNPSTARLELRRPGADANPYLALAGLLASALLGLRDGGELPPAVSGDATEAEPAAVPALPASLEAATAAFAQDGALRELLGTDFAAYYETSRRWELRAWQRAVTTWERTRYERTA